MLDSQLFVMNKVLCFLIVRKYNIKNQSLDIEESAENNSDVSVKAETGVLYLIQTLA